jgi:F420-non-reducing hydrogenase iron-sulfur subunit
MSPDFEPRIIAFVCNWCTYTAADGAGVARMAQPPNVEIVRVMCSGRIEPMFILKAFQQGADGVIVSGCHPPGDCHYVNGNFKTFRRMPLMEQLLDQFGIETERFHWGWISGAEANKWAALVQEMTERVKKLGPLDWPGYVEDKTEGAEEHAYA